MNSIKNNLFKTLYLNNPEWVPCGMENTVYIRGPLVERTSSEGFDDFGCYWNCEGDGDDDSYPSPAGYPIKDISKYKKYLKMPDLNKLDWSEAKQRAKGLDRNKYTIGASTTMGLFERSYLLLGMENALVAYIEEPCLMKELLHEIAEHKIDYITEYVKNVSPEILCYGDDWGTQTNLFMSKDIWLDIIYPETKRIAKVIRELGVFAELHSCGKIEMVFDEVVEMGFQMWGPCQPCNNLAMLKEKYGNQFVFRGGIDSQFVLNRPGVTPQEVREETSACIELLGKGGGYIAEPSHAVEYDETLLDVMENTIRKRGRAIYE